MRLSFRTAAIVVSALALAACSSDSSTAPAVVDITQVTFASSLNINLSAMTKTADGLYYQDVPSGTGAAAVSGSAVTVTYTGYLSNGTVFDSNVGKTPLAFTIGAGQVVPGFNEGVSGMLVGGSRKLVIPPALGYGAAGNGPIPGNSVIVFTVQLVSVK